MNKKNLISWTLVCGTFTAFLLIFYAQIGIAQMSIITLLFLFCIACYWGFNKISDFVSDYAEDESARPKGKLKPKTIMRIELGFGVLFAVIILNPFTILFTYFHEIGHATTALAFGIQVFSIVIISPRKGLTFLPLDYNNSLVLIAGSLSEITIAIVLLGFLYRSKTVKLGVFIAVFFSIWYNVLESVRYWHDSIFKGCGDAWDFLSFNPQIDPLWLAQLCLIIQIGFIVFLLLLFFSKIAGYFKFYFPDLSFGKFERLAR